ncbi:aspartate--tRNA ligase [Candidatus Endowatersipora endosymbiont of Watersipora subatra]|uniref:aspartate--tRNA ligase n=1 Tax=Candidatus Endowatersipora endosymbiont of Watersipora subatra TaxID=3077946 RepID=UPI00312C7E55
MHHYRSHTCADLRTSHVGMRIRLSGWVHRIRDHGGVLFIDLRDHYGMTQIVVNSDCDGLLSAEKVRPEWVIQIDGYVESRTPNTRNPNLPTGEIEVCAISMKILSRASDLPLPVFGEPDYPEDIRLKYRFLDLRRETIHRNLIRRQNIIHDLRSRMHEAGFNEFSTPILTASSPEGARDFLVPSRIHAGQFYALPQAPQQYKQLIMISGFDRYFQIAPCFRDEDPRADRLSGEFYQLDLEMSFIEQEDLWITFEPILKDCFKKFAEGKRVTPQFPRIPYKEAIRKYGTDKPDLRNPIQMQDMTEFFRDSDLKVFSEMIESDPNVEVWAIPVKGGGSRKYCDRMNSWAQKKGQSGMGYILWRELGGRLEPTGPITKNIGEERTESIRMKLGLEIGDSVFFIAGLPKNFISFAAEARNKAATDAKLIDENSYEFCWITDFPFYEWDEENKKVNFFHNPFSMPKGGIKALENKDPCSISAMQFDLVCNGFEIGSGGIRNHLPHIMVKAFEIVGLSKDKVKEHFGGIYRAFQYGAPPHGGMAAGIDRIVMLLCGAKNLREVTMFPMNQQSKDLLMDAPSDVDKKQLSDLHIRLIS